MHRGQTDNQHQHRIKGSDSSLLLLLVFLYPAPAETHSQSNQFTTGLLVSISIQYKPNHSVKYTKTKITETPRRCTPIPSDWSKCHLKDHPFPLLQVHVCSCIRNNRWPAFQAHWKVKVNYILTLFTFPKFHVTIKHLSMPVKDWHLPHNNTS